MNPQVNEEVSQVNEEISQVTKVFETNPISVGTPTNTTVTQIVSSVGTHYTPLPTSYDPWQCPPNYSYRSSGYQHSLAA